MTRARTTIGSLVVLLLGVAVAVAQAQPQFSGTWVLDRAQSQLPSHGKHGPHGEGTADRQGPPHEVKLTVEQQGNMLKATRSIARGMRERSMSETYVVDGTEQTEATRRGGTAVTRATLGGDRLVAPIDLFEPGAHASNEERQPHHRHRQDHRAPREHDLDAKGREELADRSARREQHQQHEPGRHRRHHQR